MQGKGRKVLRTLLPVEPNECEINRYSKWRNMISSHPQLEIKFLILEVINRDMNSSVFVVDNSKKLSWKEISVSFLRTNFSHELPGEGKKGMLFTVIMIIIK